MTRSLNFSCPCSFISITIDRAKAEITLLGGRGSVGCPLIQFNLLGADRQVLCQMGKSCVLADRALQRSGSNSSMTCSPARGFISQPSSVSNTLWGKSLNLLLYLGGKASAKCCWQIRCGNVVLPSLTGTSILSSSAWQ